jgi:transcriptional regulator GlxA family with amidase domain
MARGWESKSVEEQMASIQQAVPIVSAGIGEGEAKRIAEQERIRRARQKQALNLQKENILSQRTSNPARRQALEAALAQIEAEIAKLD